MRFLRWVLYACLFGLGVAAGGYLLIRISFSGTHAVVPPVVGLTSAQAQFEARRAHLLFSVQDERYDLTTPKGNVVTQNPPAGMEARRGNTLAVVVSKGIERVDMPDVLGRRMDEAQIGLRQARVRLVSTAFVHGPQPAQTVIAQDPPPDAVVPRDADVSLLVSAGPSSFVFVTPDLSGMPAQRAQLELQGYGIQAASVRTVKDSSALPGTVAGQTPAPGMPLGRQDMVQLTVSGP